MNPKHQRPFLKWAGGKYSLLKHILPLLPKGNRLVEPFVGAGSVFLNAVYPSYLLGEKNNDLIILYQYLKNEGPCFIEYCKSFFDLENHPKEQYYQRRTEFNASCDLRLKSALFMYLNRFGYNGLCRYNQSGLFNVPFGRPWSINKKPFFPQQAMEHFYHKSQSGEFLNQHFEATFEQATKGDVIYCDPPYAPLDQTTNFTTYTADKFNDEDQLFLAKLAKKASQKGIPVIISNHDTPFTRAIYQEAKLVHFKASRIISQNTQKRVPVNELLAIY